MIEFASIAVSNFDWGNYETVQGSADRIPQALRSLLDASLAQADSYYWEIENQVVVQGQLFSAAEPTLQVLVASLLDPRPGLCPYASACFALVRGIGEGRPRRIVPFPTPGFPITKPT